jgi:hypothetical protein
MLTNLVEKTIVKCGDYTTGETELEKKNTLTKISEDIVKTNTFKIFKSFHNLKNSFLSKNSFFFIEIFARKFKFLFIKFMCF